MHLSGVRQARAKKEVLLVSSYGHSFDDMSLYQYTHIHHALNLDTSPISTSHHVGLDEPRASRWTMGTNSPRRRSPGRTLPKARTAVCYCSQLNLEERTPNSKRMGPRGLSCTCRLRDSKALVPLVTSHPGTRFLATGRHLTVRLSVPSRPKGLSQGFFSSRLVSRYYRSTAP